MSQKNICKFVLKNTTDNLRIINFVHENIVPYNGTDCLFSFNVMYLVLRGEGEYKIGINSHKLKSGVLFFSFCRCAVSNKRPWQSSIYVHQI